MDSGAENTGVRAVMDAKDESDYDLVFAVAREAVEHAVMTFLCDRKAGALASVGFAQQGMSNDGNGETFSVSLRHIESGRVFDVQMTWPTMTERKTES